MDILKLNIDITKKKKLIQPEDLLPKTVENTRGELMTFDANKIIDSLIRETGLDKKTAVEVTRNVLRRISSLGLDFIAAPHLRELICGELTGQGLHRFRNQYTRLGIPIYDVKTMLEGGKQQADWNITSPALTYVWIASQVIEQYVHLDQITEKARELHLKGYINIDNMEFWNQPVCIQWDLRTIFLHGLPPINWAGVAKSRPAYNALTAVSHAAKWLSLVQSEFSAGQGYDNFTALLAPYLKDLPYKSEVPNAVDIVQVAQSFIYETNQVFGSFLGPTMDTFITCTPYIPEELWDVDAVGPGGQVVGKYKDFEHECRQFFQALVDVYSEGDADQKPIRIPRHEVKINQRGLTEFEADYKYLIEKESLPMGTTYFINNCTSANLMETHTQTFRISLFKNAETGYTEPLNYQQALINFGLIQNVNINLVRAAYLAKNSGTSILDQLDLILPEIEQILLKKYEMIQKVIDAEFSKLPFCKGILPATHLEAQPMFDLTKQFLSFSITGLAQCIKYYSDTNLQDDAGLNLASEIIDHLQQFAKDASQRNQIQFVLTDKSVKASEQRFASLDLKYFKDVANENVVIDNNGNSTYSTGINIDYQNTQSDLWNLLEQQGRLQEKIGSTAFVTLLRENGPPDFESFWNYFTKILTETAIQRFNFI
jgi:ribonucleoside-triphosphate reductase